MATLKEQVDVIVPARNRVEWLRECIHTVLGQTHSNLRLIVVDDGSVPALDSHPALLDVVSDARATVIRQSALGVARARNRGLEAADGDYILMLDSDDLLEPHAVSSLLCAALASEVECAVAAWADFYSTVEQRTIVRRQRSYTDAYACCVDQIWPTGAVMIKNDRRAKYNEHRMPWEALEFFLDYLTFRYTFVQTSELILNIRHHHNSDRLSILHDHFEAGKTGQFFLAKKQQLNNRAALNFERACALDKRILGCVHSLLCRRQIEAGRALFDEISWQIAHLYPWMRRGSFAWSSWRFGFTGAQYFIAANRLIGRA